MRGVSLFSGIGGIDLAMEAAGITLVGQVEIDPFCRTVLAKHWPYVKRLGDVHEVVGDEFGAVDLLGAGFPCPPVSVAGQRRGAADDRWLWPEVARLITAMQPAWVVLENVPGLISLGLDDVLADLETAGYEAQTLVLPACATGAPHLRERVFVVAYRNNRQREQPSLTLRTRRDATNACGVGQADTDGEWQRQPQRRITDLGRRTDDRGEDVADATQRRPRCRTASWPGGQPAQSDKAVSDPERQSLAFGGERTTRQSQPQLAGVSGRQVESRLGRSPDGLSSRLDDHQWPTGPTEAQHEWEPSRTVTHRQAYRSARLKALGNAVVPQQIYPLFAAIMAAESESPP